MAPKANDLESLKCKVGVTPVNCESCGGLYAKVVHLKSQCAYAFGPDGKPLISKKTGQPILDDADKLHWLHRESDTRICENCIYLRNMQRLSK